MRVIVTTGTRARASFLLGKPVDITFSDNFYELPEDIIYNLSFTSIIQHLFLGHAESNRGQKYRRDQ